MRWRLGSALDRAILSADDCGNDFPSRDTSALDRAKFSANNSANDFPSRDTIALDRAIFSANDCGKDFPSRDTSALDRASSPPMISATTSPAGTRAPWRIHWHPHALENENQIQLLCAMYGDASRDSRKDASGDSSGMLTEADLDASIECDPGTLIESGVGAAEKRVAIPCHICHLPGII